VFYCSHGAWTLESEKCRMSMPRFVEASTDYWGRIELRSGPWNTTPAGQTTPLRPFETTIDAHGGWNSWSQFDSVTLQVGELRGLLPLIKGLGKTFFAPQRMKNQIPSRGTAEFDYGTHQDFFNDGQLIFLGKKLG